MTVQGKEPFRRPEELHPIWAAAKFEYLPCGLCCSDAPVPQGRRSDGLELVQCGHCGLVYVQPMPDEAAVRRLYVTDFFGLSGPPSTGSYRNYARSHKYDTDARRLDFRLIAEHAGDLRGKRVLEIGCGLGDLLAVFQSRGCDCTGIELNPQAREEATRRFGIQVLDVPLEEVAPSFERQFNAVAAISVLEHIAVPGKWLDAAVRVLGQDGVLYLHTPSWDCAKAHGREWVYWRGSFEHLCYFSPAVLREACRERGLALICEGSAGPLAIRKGRPRRDATKRLKEFVKNVPVLGPVLLDFRRSVLPERLAPVNTTLADYVGLFRKGA